MRRRFDSYILREILPPFLVGLLLYTFVLLMNQILILTEQLVTRGVSLGSTLLLLLFLLPAILAFTVPMAVLMGILAGLSRLSSDSEIVAFKTLGVSPGRLLRPLLIFSLGGWLLASALSLYLAPRANYRYVRTFVGSVMAKVPFKISPRVFNESLPDTVLYIQDEDPGGRWTNILMYVTSTPEEPRLVLAKSGRLRLVPDERRAYVELVDSAEYTFPLGSPEKYSVSFAKNFRQEIPIDRLFAAFPTEKNVRMMDIGELWAHKETLGREVGRLRKDSGRPPGQAEQAERDLRSAWIEIHKKFALPFACLIFVFLSLPLGSSTRKGGRTSGFTISIGIIVVYYILITAGEELARDGRISPFLGMWGPNFVFILLSVVLFLRSGRESALSAWFRRLRRTSAAAPPPDEPGRTPKRRPFQHLAFPNILDRYIMRKFLGLFLIIVLGLLALTVVVTFFERLNVVYEHNKPLGLLARFIWHSLPEFLYYILPVAALTAMLLSLGILTKFNEVTAMKACGLSLYRIVLPVIVLAAGVSLASFTLQERVLPGANTRAQQVWDTILDLPSRSYGLLNQSWMVNRTKDRFYNFGYFDTSRSTFGRLAVYDLDPVSWTLRRRLFAERASLQGQTLRPEKGWLWNFAEDAPVRFERVSRPEFTLEEGRDFFLKKWKEPSQMSFGELRAYIREVRELGFDTVRYRVDLHSKVSFPLICLFMTLLGIPFAFSMGKRGTLVGIGLGFVIAMVYWGAIGLFRGLGYAGSLNVFLAAWGPNLVFGLAGFYGLLSLRT
ncbi:MAG: LPS export ABC transporter permease LptF [Candidatus Aminicenantes bacterium RBG_13_63_10]|nr:MAG: LPS export ABC transporter permease LptF [Candidatus Aminicenantes bacterium RBG_13_63_10]